MRQIIKPLLITVCFTPALSLSPVIAQEDPAAGSATVMETLTVTAKRQKSSWERQYQNVGGARVFSGPYGQEPMIVAISQELKIRGEKKRVFTRGITMPQSYTYSSLDRYRYTVEDECGINHFSYYEGPDFMALGYVKGPREILLDVMAGGGPFVAPGIWGPYDQIVPSRSKDMEMIMGDAQKDGLGPIKGGYMIGMKAKLRSYEMQDHGEFYGDKISTTSTCLSDKLNAEAAQKVLSGQ